ncbi:MAG: DUF1028 domain-containing protein [Bryobacteraceae bacterium]
MKALYGLLLFALAASAENVSTFSIVAYDQTAGEWGVAVASRYFAVGSVVPWAEANVGAVATQADVNVGYGPRGLQLLEQGLTARQTLTELLAEDHYQDKEGRQVAIVDSKGNFAVYTGPNAPKWAGDRQGKSWSVQGNTLAGPQVIEAMGNAFQSTQGELAEKLYAALKAGEDAGGDSRGKQSASMLVVRRGGGRNIANDRYVDINVDDNPDPLQELRRLLDINLGLVYEAKLEKLLGAGQLPQARDMAETVARYRASDPAAHITLGLLDYVSGQNQAAVDQLRAAKSLDSKNFRDRLGEISKQPVFQAAAGDQAFMKAVFARN